MNSYDSQSDVLGLKKADFHQKVKELHAYLLVQVLYDIITIKISVQIQTVYFITGHLNWCHFVNLIFIGEASYKKLENGMFVVWLHLTIIIVPHHLCFWSVGVMATGDMASYPHWSGTHVLYSRYRKARWQDVKLYPIKQLWCLG